jgi:hypothetical protein
MLPHPASALFAVRPNLPIGLFRAASPAARLQTPVTAMTAMIAPVTAVTATIAPVTAMTANIALMTTMTTNRCAGDNDDNENCADDKDYGSSPGPSAAPHRANRPSPPATACASPPVGRAV